MPTLSPEEELVLATVRRFVGEEVRPVVRDLEHATVIAAQLIKRGGLDAR